MGTRAPWALRHERPGESDEQLTDRAREGDQSAFGELYRRHRKAAESTAWCLLRSKNDAEDVVADAFAGVLSALRNGRGPRDNFRRYLLACVRNGCRLRRPPTVPMQEPGIERLSPVLEEPERYVEADTVARAFAALTPRWQYTLWLSAVEQCPAHEVSARMQLSPGATAALAHRARQAFATAYLAEHVGSVRNRACAKHAPQLAAYVRGALTAAAEAAVDHHLVTCRDCAVAAAELRDVNASLRSLSLPPPLVAAGAAAASAAAATATVATTTTTGTVVVTGGAATPAAVSGLWAALSGSSLLVKGLVAMLLATPAISAERPDAPAVGGLAGHWVAAVPGVAHSTQSSNTNGSAGDVDGGSIAPLAALGAVDTPGDPDPVSVARPVVDAMLPDDPIGDPIVGPDLAVVEPIVEPVVDSVVDSVVQPVVDSIVVPVLEPVIESVLDPLVDPVIEPAVHGLDEALATMGLGSTGETLAVLQSIVPLLDGPLADLVVTDLLGVAPTEDSDPPALTSLLSGLQDTDGSAPATPPSTASVAPPGAADVPPTWSNPEVGIPPVVSPVSDHVSSTPTTGVPDIALPAVVLPAIPIPPATVDVPPVAILDVALVEVPPIELPALSLPGVTIPPLIVLGDPH